MDKTRLPELPEGWRLELVCERGWYWARTYRGDSMIVAVGAEDQETLLERVRVVMGPDDET